MAAEALMDYNKALELYEPVLGFEVHVELNTATKMFSSAPNPANEANHDAAPNTMVAPVDMGLPGALPVVNAEAVVSSIKLGLALGCWPVFAAHPLAASDHAAGLGPLCKRAKAVKSVHLVGCLHEPADVAPRHHDPALLKPVQRGTHDRPSDAVLDRERLLTGEREPTGELPSDDSLAHGVGELPIPRRLRHTRNSAKPR